MYYNTIIILAGIVVIVIGLYIFLKKLNDNATYDIYDDINNLTNILKNNELLIKDEIKKINNEINFLKENIKTNNEEIINIIKHENFNIKEKSDNQVVPEDFGNLLNYNKFLQKNKDIITLLRKNKTAEDIAKELNKSIREVEMVLKLVK